MSRKLFVSRSLRVLLLAAVVVVWRVGPAQAQDKPNILFIVSDDTGYGDLGPYGGGEGRGMPTPNIDRLAAEGMTFFSFYAQPSCTPGRAAMQTGRIPNRSGMTTVAFQGQGGGLPAAEWTLASVLKKAGYQTYFTGKWHLGEADYALPNAQGYDVMKYCGLYHLQRLHLRRPDLVPGHGSQAAGDVREGDQGLALRQGRRKGEGGLQGQRPVRRHAGQGGVVGIPFFDNYVEKAALEFLERRGQDSRQAVLHQRQLHEGPPAEHAGARVRAQVALEVASTPTRWSSSTRASAASWTSCASSAWTRTRSSSTRPTTAPGRTSTPTPATRRSAAPRARCARAATACRRSPSGRARSRPGVKNHDIVGGLDLMATFASVAGVKLPEKDREGQPIIFDSYDMSPVLIGTGKCARTSWFYFTENELTPGAARVGNYKAVFNLRGDDGQATGGLAVDTNLGWKGAGQVRRHRAAGLRPVAGPAGALRHLHEQLHRAHLDHGDDQRGDQGPDEDLRQVSAAQAAERDLLPARSPSRSTSDSSTCGSSCEKEGISIPLPTGN